MENDRTSHGFVAGDGEVRGWEIWSRTTRDGRAIAHSVLLAGLHRIDRSSGWEHEVANTVAVPIARSDKNCSEVSCSGGNWWGTSRRCGYDSLHRARNDEWPSFEGNGLIERMSLGKSRW